MPVIAHIIPATTVLCLVLVSVLPWGFGESLRFVMPVLPFAAVYFWIRAHAPLSSVVVFSAGLIVDVLTYGPLGYWSLIYLSGMGLAVGLDHIQGRDGSWARWLDFGAVSLLLFILAWLVASIYFVVIVDWTPMALALMSVIAIYPLVSAMLSPLERFVRGPQPLQLARKV